MRIVVTIVVFIVGLWIGTGETRNLGVGLVLGGIFAGVALFLTRSRKSKSSQSLKRPEQQDLAHNKFQSLVASQTANLQSNRHVSSAASLEARVANLESQVSQLSQALAELGGQSEVKTNGLTERSGQTSSANAKSTPLNPQIRVVPELRTQPNRLELPSTDGPTPSVLSASSNPVPDKAPLGTLASPQSAALNNQVEPRKIVVPSQAVAVSPALEVLAPSVQPRAYSPPAPSAPAEPGFIEKAFKAAKDWVFGGNTLVRVGIIVMFFGVAFLLKYATDNSMIPIELRLTAVVLLALGLILVGWRARTGKPGFSYAMQGGGVGVLYLTLFAAFKLYALIPAGLTFGLLAGVAFMSAALAVLQNALALAILGFSGGFIAPILVSTGGGSHVGLFSYYLVLNLGIAAVAFYRGWRPLNVLGFAFTFVIGTLWGVQKYTPEFFATTEPFLIAHGLIYTFIAIAYAFKRQPNAKDYVDATLVFGTPLVGFSLQYGLVHDSKMGLAYSALALGGYYMALAWWVLKRKRETLVFLGECFLALGMGFATLAIPLALDGRWTSASWALEGVALLWVGLKQTRFLPSAAGLALQVLGAGAFAMGWGLTGSQAPGEQNMFLGAAFVAFSGLACGALLLRHSRALASGPTVLDVGTGLNLFGLISNRAPLLAGLAALWGWAWLMLSGWRGIEVWMGDESVRAAFSLRMMLFVAVSSVGLLYLAKRLSWPMLRGISFALLPVMVLAFVVGSPIPSQYLGWLSWPLSLALYALMLRLDKAAPAAVHNGITQALGLSSRWVWVNPAVWLAAVLVYLQLNHWVANWHLGALPVLYAVEGAVFVVLALRIERFLPTHISSLWGLAGGGLVLQGLAMFELLLKFNLSTANITNIEAHRLATYGYFWQFFVLAACGLVIGVCLLPRAKVLCSVLAGWVWGCLALGGYFGVNYAITYYSLGYDHPRVGQAVLAYLAVMSLVVYGLGRSLTWPTLRQLGFAILPISIAATFVQGTYAPASTGWGWFAWPLALAALPLLLNWDKSRSPKAVDARALSLPWNAQAGWLWRAPWFWLLTYLAVLESSRQTMVIAKGDWPVLAALGSVMVLVMGLLKLRGTVMHLSRNAWVKLGAGPVLAVLMLYGVYATLNLAGNTPPLPYLPVLNPLEISLLGVVLLAAMWVRKFKELAGLSGEAQDYLATAPTVLAVVGFIWLNSVLLRSLHHYASVPYFWVSILDNVVARAAFTLLWSLSALGLMLYAHKKAQRILWMVGAALMAVVVAKLFLLDLAGRGTIERIISFMGAGALLLVMGYFAPLPPANPSKTKAE